MKPYYRFFCTLLLSLFFLVSCSDDDNNSDISAINYNAENAYELTNIPYGSEERQVADIYLPPNRDTQNTKVLLLIHGGAWVQGNKEEMNYMIPIAQQHYPDYAIVNMNYRFPENEGDTAFPMQIDDVEMLITHLAERKENYHIAEKFGLIGVSAGGHLSLLYSYARDDNNRIKAICSIVGPTDFTDENYLDSSFYDPFRITLIGDYHYDTNPEKFEEVSPVHRATQNSAPTIMFYGDQDPLVPTTQGQRLEAKLNELGVYNEFYLYEGVGHANFSTAQFNEVQENMLVFFDEFL